jgi:membrane protein
MKNFWGFIKELGGRFSEDKLPKLAAALAYYSSFALAPILVIAVPLARLN